MAEVAGLVIGGVALASLFDTCINTFDRLDAGRNCGRDYQEAALRISLLGNRLRRWEDTYRTSLPSSSPEDGSVAKQALQSIEANLKTVCKTSTRYQQPGSTNGVAAMTEKLQNLTVVKEKISLPARFTWALHDKAKLDMVISSIKFKLDELESLSRTLVPAIKQHAQREAEQLVQPESIEEPNETIPILKASASAADPYFHAAVANATGHLYKNLKIANEAHVANGDHIAEGYAGPFSSAQNSYVDMQVLDKARVLNGTQYGGKSIFDD